MKKDRKDVLCRAAKTFWQAMLAYLFADLTLLREALADWESEKRLLLTLIVGALAAGFSAAWNGALKPLWEGKRNG